MKISANSIQQGNYLLHNNELWVVIKQPEHTKPGKGGAFVQVEMKNMKGIKTKIRFPSYQDIEKANITKRKLQFLYKDSSHLVLMDQESFEQIPIDENLLGNKLPFLEDGMILEVEFWNEIALNAAILGDLIAVVTQTEPHLKGSTATAMDKPAILENGIRVMVPSYLKSGEKIIVKEVEDNFIFQKRLLQEK